MDLVEADFVLFDAQVSQAFPLFFILLDSFGPAISSEDEDGLFRGVSASTMDDFHLSHFMCSKGTGNDSSLLHKELGLLFCTWVDLKLEGLSPIVLIGIARGWESSFSIPLVILLGCGVTTGCLSCFQALELEVL
jgi:hypothetical protein